MLALAVSISKGEQAIYDKTVEKFEAIQNDRSKDDETNRVVRKALNVIRKTTLSNLLDKAPSKDMKAIFSSSLQYCILSNQFEYSDCLTKFAKDRKFNLSLYKRQLRYLIDHNKFSYMKFLL